MICRKGLEFSIQVLVIFFLALVVLIGVLTFFIRVGGGGADELTCDADFQAACNEFLAAGGCGDSSIDIRRYIGENEVQCGVGSADYALAKQVCCQ